MGKVLANCRAGIGEVVHVLVKSARGGLLRAVRRLRAIVNQAQGTQLEAAAEFDRTADQPSNVPLELSLGLTVSKHTAPYPIGLVQALTTRSTPALVRAVVVEGLLAQGTQPLHQAVSVDALRYPAGRASVLDRTSLDWFRRGTLPHKENWNRLSNKDTVGHHPIVVFSWLLLV